MYFGANRKDCSLAWLARQSNLFCLFEIFLNHFHPSISKRSFCFVYMAHITGLLAATVVSDSVVISLVFYSIIMFVFYVIVIVSLKEHTRINQWLKDNLKDYKLYWLSK